jgi:hypothetical protein
MLTLRRGRWPIARECRPILDFVHLSHVVQNNDFDISLIKLNFDNNLVPLLEMSSETSLYPFYQF